MVPYSTNVLHYTIYLQWEYVMNNKLFDRERSKQESIEDNDIVSEVRRFVENEKPDCETFMSFFKESAAQMNRPERLLREVPSDYFDEAEMHIITIRDTADRVAAKSCTVGM